MKPFRQSLINRNNNLIAGGLSTEMHLPLYKSYNMETIYWIQRLGYINTVSWIIFALASLFTILFSIGCCIEISNTYCKENEKKWRSYRRKGLRYGGWIAGISLLIGIFVPTTSELYAIYGIGGTIDYIKSNDTAKQLPDKVINALDAWIDNQTDNNNDK